MLCITRPLDDALVLANLLAERGVEGVVSPIMSVQQFSKPTVFDADAVILTSRHAVPEGPIGVPCFVVGDQTAQALPHREALQVFENVDALIKAMPDALPTHSRVLYLRGRQVRKELTEQLPHYQWQEHICYEAQSVEAFSPDAHNAFDQQKVRGVIFFSARTAMLFEDLYQKVGLPKAELTAICISDSVVKGLRLPIWKKHVIAPSPNMAGLLTSIHLESDNFVQSAPKIL